MLTGAASDARFLDDLGAVSEIVSSLITAVAVIVGAWWAYFKFIKNRTYRPRLDVTMHATCVNAGSRTMLLGRVAVKNIGNSDVELLQRGTGLRMSRLADVETPDGQSASWQSIKVYEVFKQHAWIEPGETISDDVLVGSDVLLRDPVLLETRLVWSWKGDEGNIVVSARQVFPPAASPSDAGSGEPSDRRKEVS